MRERKRILASLESTYREAFDRAGERDDEDAMARLDFEYQRDQIRLEVLLDIRELLTVPSGEDEEEEKSLLDRAEALRRITKLR